MLLFSIIAALLMVVADQVTKMMAVSALYPYGAQAFIPGFLRFRYIENTGAAFSFLTGMQPFLIVVTSIALLAVAFALFVRRPKYKLEVVSLTMILAGGAGNLIDRISRGYVVDFLEFEFIRFPVFNIADCFVCVGFALLVIAFIQAELRERKQKKAEDAEPQVADAED